MVVRQGPTEGSFRMGEVALYHRSLGIGHLQGPTGSVSTTGCARRKAVSAYC